MGLTTSGIPNINEPTDIASQGFGLKDLVDLMKVLGGEKTTENSSQQTTLDDTLLRRVFGEQAATMSQPGMAQMIASVFGEGARLNPQLFAAANNAGMRTKNNSVLQALMNEKQAMLAQQVVKLMMSQQENASKTAQAIAAANKISNGSNTRTAGMASPGGAAAGMGLSLGLGTLLNNLMKKKQQEEQGAGGGGGGGGIKAAPTKEPPLFAPEKPDSSGMPRDMSKIFEDLMAQELNNLGVAPDASFQLASTLAGTGPMSLAPWATDFSDVFSTGITSPGIYDVASGLFNFDPGFTNMSLASQTDAFGNPDYAAILADLNQSIADVPTSFIDRMPDSWTPITDSPSWTPIDLWDYGSDSSGGGSYDFSSYDFTDWTYE